MTEGKPPNPLFFCCFFFFFRSISAVDFLFNGFDPSDINLYGNATIQSRILTLTNETHFSTGRAFYGSKIRAKSPNYPYSPLSFSTSFIFSMGPPSTALSGHGIAFLLTPSPATNGTSNGQNLGLFHGTNNGSPNNHVFAVEFDVFQNQEFKDIDANHVGVDLNSLTSTVSHTAGFFPPAAAAAANNSNSNSSFIELKLNNGVNYQAWIDFSGSLLNISMARAGSDRPKRPIISAALNLSAILLDEMYVGFTAATGQLIETHRILSWSFSNSNFSAYQGLITSNLPSFVPPKDPIFRSQRFIAGISLASIALLGALVLIYFIWARRNSIKRRRDEERDAMEDWELEYWPHRIRYSEISAATKGFSEENVIGIGGSGKVYRGVLGSGSVEIAVKRIPQENEHGLKEFLAEVSSLGRLKHRNLVALVGWCKREKGGLMLAYEYMENGSLDKRVFPEYCDESSMLSWDARLRVLKDVAAGVLYLHEGWEVSVLHRDIKASNVMLDSSMNGRLGDFGLARMHAHGLALATTRVVGTVGYMAPEVVRSGKASAKTDVFGFGVLVLEVVCGRRPVEEGSQPLVEWVWGLMENGEIVRALDQRLRLKGGWDEEEVERVLHLGLVCAHPDQSVRPSMRQVVRVLEGAKEMDEWEGDGMETYLLHKAEYASSWFARHQKWSMKMSNHHPTFQDVKQSQSSSISLSDSDIIAEGR